MTREFSRFLCPALAMILVLVPGGDASAASDEDAIADRLTEVGIAIERQIELAQHNFERGTLDKATLQRQAEAAADALESLERRIHSLPDGASDQLLTKLHAVQAQAANLARAAELGTAPPRRQSGTPRVKHLNRRGGGTRAVPANDNCEGAFVVGLGTFAGDTAEATNDGGAVCGSSLYTPDVWYRFVPVSSGYFLAETAGSAYDTVLSVHTGCPGTISNQIVCNDDSAGLQSKVTFWVSAGTEYLIRVSGNDGAVGSYLLAIDSGGAIEGAVIDTPTGSPVDTRVEVFDGDGFQVGSGYTDGSGSYIVDGLGTGPHFVATNGSGETIDELFDDHPCPGGPNSGCDVINGDEVAVSIGTTTGGIDFVLDQQGVITGTVIDEASTNAIYDVRVNLFDDVGNYLRRDYTDASGVYRFGGLPVGDYYLWATVFSHKPELYDDVSCPGGPSVGCVVADGTLVAAMQNGSTSGIDFELEKLGAISGTVVDRLTGLPIGYADVYVYDASGDYVNSRDTAADGTYEVGGLPDGVYFVSAWRSYSYIRQLYDMIDCPASGCEILSGTPVVIAGNATVAGVDFGLIARGTITGHVQDEITGTGIPGVDVRLYDETGSYVGYDATDSSGDYEVDELYGGTFYAVAVDNEYFNELYDDIPCSAGCDPTGGTPVVLSNGTTTSGIDFSLGAKGKITGTVTAEVGGDPVWMRIMLYDDQGGYLESDTSYSGTFEFVGLDDGQYFVLADSLYLTYPYLEELFDDIPCWGGLPEGCTVTDGTPVAAVSATVTSDIDFSLQRKAFIEGSVVEVPSGAPVTDGVVRIFESSFAGNWYDSDSLDSNGSYRIDDLLPGSYVLVVDAYRHRDEVWDELPCGAEYPAGCNLTGGTPIAVAIASEIDNIDFSLERLGSVSGIVRSAATGAPVRWLDVMVYSDDGQEIDGGSTDDYGNYHVDRLWPGTYFAVTDSQHPNFVDQLFEGLNCPQGPPIGCDPTSGSPVAVGFNTSVRWVDFDLESTGSVSGRVTDADTGIPLNGVRVRAWDSLGVGRWSDETDINGDYHIVGLEAGTFFVATEEFAYGTPFIDLLFDGIPCAGGPPIGCDPTRGTPVAVSHGSTTASVDFALPPMFDGIAGVVTDATTGGPLEGVKIDVWEAYDGDYEFGVTTSAAGTFIVDLYPGTYFVSTDNPGAWVNQIWEGIECPQGSAFNGDCDPMTGDVVTVTAGILTDDIDFVLAPTFVVFADGFESGSTVRWSNTTR